MLKDSVISPAGRRAVYGSAIIRIALAVGIALVLIALSDAFGRAFTSSGSTVPTVPTGGTLLTWHWVLIIGGTALAGTCAFVEMWYGGRQAHREERRIRARLLTRFFEICGATRTEDEAQAGRLITLMTGNSERLTEYRQTYYGSTIAAMTIPFLVLTYVAIAIDAVIGLVLLAFCPLIPLAVIGFMKLFAGSSANSRRERAQLSAKYLDAIRNLVIIRLMGAGPRIEKDLRERGEKNRGAIMRLLMGNQIVIIVMDGMFSLALICAAAILTVIRYHAGAIDLGQAMAVILLSALLLEPLSQVAGFFYIGMGGKASERAIKGYLARTAKQAGASPVSTEVPTTTPPAPTAHAESGQPIICARNLTYDYGRGPVLNDVNLEVAAGEKIAIVGRSGGGKSTLLSLLRGALRPQGGTLEIAGDTPASDGTAGDGAAGGAPAAGDASAVASGVVRRQNIATVSQRTWLFTGTIRSNLQLAAPGASDEQMWSALARANVASEVERMPGGLDSSVGEQGVLISGGQAQRISLARAFLSGRRILLLDEPTSQVDIDSEQRLIEAIGQIGREYTVVMVTHRRALIEIADRTLEMSGGVLSEYHAGAHVEVDHA